MKYYWVFFIIKKIFFDKYKDSLTQKYRKELCLLGLCLYEVICDEKEFILMSEVIFKEEKDITQHDVENKQLKEVNGKVRKEENEKVESRKVESRKKKKERK